MMRGWLPLFGLFTVVVVVSLPFSLRAQPRERIDSLLSLVNTSKDTSRWQIYKELSLAYPSISVDSALFFADAARSLALDLKQDDLLFQAYNLLGIVHVRRQEYEQTLQYFLQALRLAETYQEESWKLYQAQALINIGGVFLAQRQTDRALEYSHRSRSILELLTQPKVLADNYQSIGMMHKSREAPDSAQIYFSKALERYRQVGDKLKEGRTLGLIGEIYAGQKQYAEALKFYDQSLEMAQNTQDVFTTVDRIKDIGEAYLQQQQLDKAAQALHRALALCTTGAFDGKRRLIYNLLSDLHVQQNRYDSAYYYQQLYIPLYEEVYNAERSQQIDELEAVYQNQRKTLENQMLLQQNRSIQNRNIYTTIIAALLLLIVIFGSFLYRNQQRKNAIISRQNLEVRELMNELAGANSKLANLLEEKSHLVGLITHDMQTPLSVIKFTIDAMLHEQKNGAVSDDLMSIKSAAQQVSHLCDRIFEAQQLDEDQLQLEIQPLPIGAIIREAAKPYLQWAKQKGVQVILEADPDFVVRADPFLLGKAFGNLLGNAIKFSEPGKIVRVLLSIDNGKGRIAVEDKGPGMSRKDQKKAFLKNKKLSAQPTHGEPGTGNGLYLTKRYIEAMSGIVTLESTPGQGSTFAIELPLTIAEPVEKT